MTAEKRLMPSSAAIVLVLVAVLGCWQVTAPWLRRLGRCSSWPGRYGSSAAAVRRTCSRVQGSRWGMCCAAGRRGRRRSATPMAASWRCIRGRKWPLEPTATAPRTGGGEDRLAVRFLQGALRAVTGKIGRRNPQNYRVNNSHRGGGDPWHGLQGVPERRGRGGGLWRAQRHRCVHRGGLRRGPAPRGGARALGPAVAGVHRRRGRCCRCRCRERLCKWGSKCFRMVAMVQCFWIQAHHPLRHSSQSQWCPVIH
jgi:hypothetical protein